MATFTVTTSADAVDAGDGVLSLREAVQRANATAAADTILFAPAVEGRTLTLTQGQPIEVTQDVAIDGDRDGDGWGVTIDGADRTLVLRIAGTGRTDATLMDLGVANGGIGAYDNDYYGRGGGIVLEDGHVLAMSRCTVTGSYAARDGGGIALGRGSSAVITESLIRDNGSEIPGSATGDYTTGGGIHAEGAALYLVRSTVADNRTAQRGGGIHVEDGTLRVVDSTVVGNSAAKFIFGFGGGISAVSSQTSVVGSTVTGNFAYNGYFPDQVFNRGAGISATGALTLENSIVAGNVSGEWFGPQVYDDDVLGTVTSSNGHNVFGTDVAGSAAGDLEAVDPALLFAATDPRTGGGVLALNGGPTPTVALRDALDNPALSGAEPVAAGSADQRSAFRPLPEGTNPDVGAFELDQDAVSRDSSSGSDALVGTVGADTLSGRDGADRLSGRGGNDRLSGDAGGDTMLGGIGDDTLDGGTGLDTASYRDAGGAIAASLARQASSGAAGADRLLRLENLQGGRLDDRLEGDALANALGGGGGDDRLIGLKGDDLLRGADGADLLRGGRGADLLAGGPGRDLFGYDALADSLPSAGRRDLVLDFGRGADRLDLSALDARPGEAGNQAFTFLAAEDAAFTGAGQLRWFRDEGRTLVEASADADTTAEMQVELTGLRDLAAADFVL